MTQLSRWLRSKPPCYELTIFMAVPVSGGTNLAYMYILECADGSYYTGSTVALNKRVWEHENFQGANHTRKKWPVKLVYSEKFERIDLAFYREKQIQGWSHAKKKALIEGNRIELQKLAECQNASHSAAPAASSTLLSHQGKGSVSQ